jgi:hypothetical protein
VVDETETVDSKKRGREGEGEDERVIRLFLSFSSLLPSVGEKQQDTAE